MSAPEPPDVERLRAALARLSDEPGWPETDDERLFSALHGDVPAEERRAVVDELVRNPRAAASWRLARELDPGPQERAAAAGTAPAWKWMSIAAMLLLVAGVAWQFGPWPADVPIYRSTDARQIESALPPGAPLPRTDAVLQWTPVEGARYRVRVLTPELDLLDEAEDLAEPRYRVDAGRLRAIPPGGQILWQVEAMVRGASPVVSPTFTVQLE